MAYGKVEENFYSRSEVRSLSFFGKSVLIYLLVNHHRNFIGLYFLPHSYAIAEIERLKNFIIQLSDEKNNEIARLKAELATRPKAVKCEECIYKNQCKKTVVFQKSTPKVQGQFKFHYLNFCSYGYKESEGKR